MRLTVKNIILSSLVALICLSCTFKDNGITLSTSISGKNVRYVASLVSSSVSANPVITYSNSSSGTVQVEELSLDLTLQLNKGTKATLTGSCSGIYNPSVGQTSTVVDLKIYLNDPLQAQAYDIQTDASADVNASATCSYIIK
jgi:cobalamin biosynthesis protein CbiG